MQHQRTSSYFVLWCFLVVAVSGCKKESNLGADSPQASFKGLVVPSYFPTTHYQFVNNEITQAGFELGRKLFYDPRLSTTNSISCGTCHAQVHGFADHGTPVSFGIHGRAGKRNSPALFNLSWMPSFMWDGGINHIEIMPLAPLTDSLEMGESMLNVVAKLQSFPEYQPLFEKAFGHGEINDQKLFRALAQFMGMLISADSKYDKVQMGIASFTPLEQQGYLLFKQNCDACHAEPLFTDYTFRNNGLDSVHTDQGRMRITQVNTDLGKFKVPSLRNLNFTYPYMHDGRFFSLDAVLNHYESGIVQQANLDPLLQNGIQFSTEERSALKAFLNTLNDYSFIGDHRFSER